MLVSPFIIAEIALFRAIMPEFIFPRRDAADALESTQTACFSNHFPAEPLSLVGVARARRLTQPERVHPALSVPTLSAMG